MVRSWTRRSFVTFAVLSVTGVLVRVAFISRVGEDARPAGCPAPAASSSSGPAVCALRSAPPANKTVYFGFPPRARMRSMRERCAAVADDDAFRRRWLPVTHTNYTAQSGAVDAHFYYFAKGCSDLHLWPGKVVVAFNHMDAAVQLAAMRANRSARALVEHVARAMRNASGARARAVCGLPAAVAFERRLRMTPCELAYPFGASDRCLWAWQPDVLRDYLDASSAPAGADQTRGIARLAGALGVDTIVLKFRGAGLLQRDIDRWKTEVFRTVPFEADTFYDEACQRCEIAGHRRKCIMCSQGTPLLRRACGAEAWFGGWWPS